MAPSIEAEQNAPRRLTIHCNDPAQIVYIIPLTKHLTPSSTRRISSGLAYVRLTMTVVEANATRAAIKRERGFPAPGTICRTKATSKAYAPTSGGTSSQNCNGCARARHPRKPNSRLPAMRTKIEVTVSLASRVDDEGSGSTGSNRIRVRI